LLLPAIAGPGPLARHAASVSALAEAAETVPIDRPGGRPQLALLFSTFRTRGVGKDTVDFLDEKQTGADVPPTGGPDGNPQKVRCLLLRQSLPKTVFHQLRPRRAQGMQRLQGQGRGLDHLRRLLRPGPKVLEVPQVDRDRPDLPFSPASSPTIPK